MMNISKAVDKAFEHCGIVEPNEAEEATT